MAEYRFPATEALVERGFLGKQAAARLDAHLHERTTTSMLKPSVVAAVIDVRQRDVESALAEYASRGVLSCHEMVACQACETMAEAEEVQAAREAGDDFPCYGQCDRDLAKQEFNVIPTYRLIDTPT